MDEDEGHRCMAILKARNALHSDRG